MQSKFDSMVSKNDLALAHDLRHVVKTLNRQVRKRVREAGQWSEADENVMRFIIERKEVVPSQICAALGLSSQFTSQVLNRLEGMNYISRKPSAQDKRKILVSLSAKGRGLVDTLRHETDEWMAAALSEKFTKTQKEIIKQAVELLSGLNELQ